MTLESRDAESLFFVELRLHGVKKLGLRLRLQPLDSDSGLKSDTDS